jgi:aryl-alcohol dehydrogenase-like predicted oxidoreductase
MRRAHAQLEKRGLPLAANQVEYSLLQREIETNGILDAAQELGVTIIAYTPLASGLLTGKYHKNPELLQNRSRLNKTERARRNMERSRPVVAALEEIASQHGATPAQVALNWLIHFQGETVVTIPGATKPGQAAESAGAMGFRLTDDQMARLDELTRQFR